MHTHIYEQKKNKSQITLTLYTGSRCFAEIHGKRTFQNQLFCEVSRNDISELKLPHDGHMLKPHHQSPEKDIAESNTTKN